MDSPFFFFFFFLFSIFIGSTNIKIWATCLKYEWCGSYFWWVEEMFARKGGKEEEEAVLRFQYYNYNLSQCCS